MKTGRSIHGLAREILRQKDAKQDYLVSTDSLTMGDGDERPMLHLRDAAGTELVEPLGIQQTAHRQIGDYLGIPRKYYERMLGEDVTLLTQNVNSWLRHKSEQRMIRIRSSQHGYRKN